MRIFLYTLYCLLNISVLGTFLYETLCPKKAFSEISEGIKPEKSKPVSHKNNTKELLSRTNVRVGLFYENRITCLMIAPQEGNYNVFFDGRLREDIEKDFVFQITVIGDSIEVRGIEKKYGLYKTVQIVGTDSVNMFKIKPVMPDKATRSYDDDLQISLAAGTLKIINDVNIDNYVASVVESEVGVRTTLEYYKVQAIICRTYALGHLRRHEAEGYNLCDAVHCQVDHGNARVTDAIHKAVSATNGLVMVDNNMELALAAFHSNCGGQTVNSEEVWSMGKSYLKSVPDSFCTKQLHSCWQKKIPVDDWTNYFSYKYKINTRDSMVCKQILNFSQPARKATYFNVPLKNLRTDWNLKSTFFTVSCDDNYVYLTGRGYGHGVGLCQEGAMNMAKLGYSYKDILKYYYRNINLLNLNQLSFFKE